MDKIKESLPKAEELVKELFQNDPKLVISDEFTTVCKRLLDTYYIFKKDPLASSFRRLVADTIFSQQSTVQNIGNVLAVLLHEVLRVSPMFDESIVSLPAYKSAAFVQGAVLNFTDCSSKFSTAILKNKKFVHCNKLILEHLATNHSRLTTDQSPLHFLKCCLCSVYNILKYGGEDARSAFNMEGYIQIIEQYSTSSVPDIKNISCLILTYLVSEDQFEKFISEETIEFVITSISSNFEQPQQPRRGFETSELCLSLRELAKNDVVSNRIVWHNGVQALGTALSKGTSREKCAAALALLSLAFNDDARARIRSSATLSSDVNAQLLSLGNQIPRAVAPDQRRGAAEDGLVDFWGLKSWVLEKGNMIPEVKAISPVDRRLKTALWMQALFRRLQWELNIDDELHERRMMKRDIRRDETTPHVMISYSHAQKSVAQTIARVVNQAGYPTWIDIEQMQNEADIVSGMANAVEGAFVVCVVYSEAYKRSPNARLEAQYAHRLGKPMIFCRSEPGYSPDGWLGLLLGMQAYIDCSGKYPQEEVSKQLRHQLHKLTNKSPQRIEDTSPKEYGNSPSRVRDDINNWDTAKVNDWFRKEKIPLLHRETITGKDLIFLKKMQSSAPESFFRFLTDTWRIDSVPLMRSLADALERLQ